jgi:hypothetical protein
LAEVQEEIETQRHRGHREKQRGEKQRGEKQRGREKRGAEGREKRGAEGRGRGREGKGRGHSFGGLWCAGKSHCSCASNGTSHAKCSLAM